MPGDNVVPDVELIAPVAIEQGMRFAIREGGRSVGLALLIKLSLNRLVLIKEKEVRENELLFFVKKIQGQKDSVSKRFNQI